MAKLKYPILLVLLVLIIDQALKIWIKTNMHLGESSFHHWDWWNIEWFQLYFTENPGMAFGMEFSGEWGKLGLSIFRIIASIGIAWYAWILAKKNAPVGVLMGIGLIFAGAVGNILDSAFYGIFFSKSSYFETAQLFPADGGYQTFLHGSVVDMLYFPLLEGHYPSWFPEWSWFPMRAGREFIFFRPIFNIADASITSGVLLIMLFYRNYFSEMDKAEQKPEVVESTSA